MAMVQDYPKLSQSLMPELRSIVMERTESLLLRIVQANLDTQYATKTTSLADFRHAVSARSYGSDALLVEDFRRHVPLSDYDSYKPFMSVFDQSPCKEAELENLFAPGLPSFLAISSATSGKSPKLFPKYHVSSPNVFDPQKRAAAIVFYGSREVKEVEREPGQIVKRIPVSTVTGALVRAMLGWTDIDDDVSRMSLIVPGLTAPWAASVIKHYESFLMVHAVFALACRDLDCIFTTFSTLFYDLVRRIHEEWEVLLSSIRNGMLPDLPGIGEVQAQLRVHLHANPERAAELCEIGPPFSRARWAVHVWPKLELISMICSGPFATVLPKVRSIIGPTIAIRTPDYGSSESVIATPHRPDDLDIYVLRSSDLVEFLDVTAEESREGLRQAWELEVGKQYEIVLTTNDGLWRYRLGDIINVIGFDADNGSPVFVISGRRSSAIRFPGMLVTDSHIISAIQAISPDVMQVNEFTTMLDDRHSTRTVGFFVDLAATIGPDAHLAPSKLSEGFAAAISEFQGLLNTANVRHPTIRIMRPGAFAEYRQWRAEKINVGPGQVKVPTILPDVASIEWILERVVGEL